MIFGVCTVWCMIWCKYSIQWIELWIWLIRHRKLTASKSDFWEKLVSKVFCWFYYKRYFIKKHVESEEKEEEEYRKMLFIEYRGKISDQFKKSLTSMSGYFYFEEIKNCFTVAKIICRLEYIVKIRMLIVSYTLVDIELMPKCFYQNKSFLV